MVETTRFGDNVQITVNYGKEDYKMPLAVLPPHGFVVESPTFKACYARSFQGQTFAEPTFLVVRSLDDHPLETAGRVRFFRAFGDRQIRWNGKVVDVDGDLTVTGTNP